MVRSDSRPIVNGAPSSTVYHSPQNSTRSAPRRAPRDRLGGLAAALHLHLDAHPLGRLDPRDDDRRLVGDLGGPRAVGTLPAVPIAVLRVGVRDREGDRRAVGGAGARLDDGRGNGGHDGVLGGRGPRRVGTLVERAGERHGDADATTTTAPAATATIAPALERERDRAVEVVSPAAATGTAPARDAGRGRAWVTSTGDPADAATSRAARRSRCVDDCRLAASRSAGAGRSTVPPSSAGTMPAAAGCASTS